MAIDKVTLELRTTRARCGGKHGLHTLSHSPLDVREGDRGLHNRLTTPAGETFATPVELGATWFVGLNYGPVISSIETPGGRRHLHHQRPVFGVRVYHSLTCTSGSRSSTPVAWSRFPGPHHNTDVGGAVPASLSRTLTEVEGISAFRPAKIMRKARINTEVLDIFRQRARAGPDVGDLKAQIAPAIGERKVHDMRLPFGIETFETGAAACSTTPSKARAGACSPHRRRDLSLRRHIDEDAVDGKPCCLSSP
ncbi:MAG: hydantoinase B/oxoprolinase family protein [Hyphomicrobiaceae bacterium]